MNTPSEADLDSNLDSNPDSKCYVKGGLWSTSSIRIQPEYVIHCHTAPHMKEKPTWLGELKGIRSGTELCRVAAGECV